MSKTHWFSCMDLIPFFHPENYACSFTLLSFIFPVCFVISCFGRMRFLSLQSYHSLHIHNVKILALLAGSLFPISAVYAVPAQLQTGLPCSSKRSIAKALPHSLCPDIPSSFAVHFQCSWVVKWQVSEGWDASLSYVFSTSRIRSNSSFLFHEKACKVLDHQ